MTTNTVEGREVPLYRVSLNKETSLILSLTLNVHDRHNNINTLLQINNAFARDLWHAYQIGDNDIVMFASGTCGDYISVCYYTNERYVYVVGRNAFDSEWSAILDVKCPKGVSRIHLR